MIARETPSSLRPEATREAEGAPFGRPLIVARGLGGAIEIYEDRIKIVKMGLISVLFGMARATAPMIETIIPVHRVSAFQIVSPLVLHPFITFAYPGSPPLTGSYFRDATAENALMMNYFDNRNFYLLKDHLEVLVAHARAAAGPLPVD
ncbi:MAG: hypothetical protein ACT4P2_11020 [Pseudomonadota bacterium]